MIFLLCCLSFSFLIHQIGSQCVTWSELFSMIKLLQSCLCGDQMWFLGLVPFNQLSSRLTPSHQFPRGKSYFSKRFLTELLMPLKNVLNICTYLALCIPNKCCILRTISILSLEYLWHRLILLFFSQSDLKLKSCISNVDLPLVVVI